MKEKRELKVIFVKPGGTASKNSLSYRFTIPNKWANDMEIELEDRMLEVVYDYEKKEITIKKKTE